MDHAFEPYHRGYDLFMITFGLYRTDKVRRMVNPGPGERVVDLGGGTGYLASKLARRGADAVVLDTSPGMLSVARRRPGVSTVLGDARHAPFPDESFDLALLADMLHHVREADQVVAETRRILKPGGRLLIHDFDCSRALGRLSVLWERLLFKDIHPRSRSDVETMAARQGFRLVREMTGWTWFLLLFEK